MTRLEDLQIAQAVDGDLWPRCQQENPESEQRIGIFFSCLFIYVVRRNSLWRQRCFCFAELSEDEWRISEDSQSYKRRRSHMRAIRQRCFLATGWFASVTMRPNFEKRIHKSSFSHALWCVVSGGLLESFAAPPWESRRGNTSRVKQTGHQQTIKNHPLGHLGL